MRFPSLLIPTTASLNLEFTIEKGLLTLSELGFSSESLKNFEKALFQFELVININNEYKI